MNRPASNSNIDKDNDHILPSFDDVFGELLIKFKKAIKEKNDSNSVELCEDNNTNPEGYVNFGRWTNDEHELFLKGIHEYGNDWTLIQKTFIPSRTCVQIRTHAQKLFKAAGGVSAFSHLEDSSRSSCSERKEESVSTSAPQAFVSPINRLKKGRKGSAPRNVKASSVEVQTVSETFRSPTNEAQKRKHISTELAVASCSDAKEDSVTITPSIASEALASPSCRTPKGRRATSSSDAWDRTVLSPQEKSTPSIHHMQTRRRGYNSVA